VSQVGAWACKFEWFNGGTGVKRWLVCLETGKPMAMATETVPTRRTTTTRVPLYCMLVYRAACSTLHCPLSSRTSLVSTVCSPDFHALYTTNTP
jgi:hypothetical protein